MKRKFAALYAVLASAIMMQSVTFADVAQPKTYVYNAESAAAEETAEVSSFAEETAAYVEAEDDAKPVSAYAGGTSSQNFVDYVGIDSKGTKYTLVANTEYSYKNGTTEMMKGAIITNISQDSKNVQAEIEIPKFVTSSTGEQVPVISIGETAFDSCYAVSITVPSSVVEIQDRAFTNCSKLKYLYINGAEQAYVYSVDQPNGTTLYYPVKTVIGKNVAANSTALVTAKVTGFETIGDSMFEGCSSLKNVSIHIDGNNINGVTGKEIDNNPRLVTLAARTFYGCSALEEITLDDTVSSIGNNTFIGCTALKRVNVGKMLRFGLAYEDFVLPSTTTEMDYVNLLADKEGYNARLKDERDLFEETNCISLEEIKVSGDNTAYSDVDGILYNKVQTELIFYPLNSSIKNYTASDDLLAIQAYALYDNRSIESFTAGGSKTLDIRAYSFYGSSIKSLALNRTEWMNVGLSAFRNCSNLSSVSVAENHGGMIGDYAFMNCDNLKGEFTLKGWRTVGSYAFAGCDGITSVVADVGVGTFGNYVFTRCDALAKADLTNVGRAVKNTPGNITFGTYVFAECPSLKETSFNPGLLGISTGTFYNDEKLEKVVCYEDVGIIENFAFYNCKSLKDVSEIRFLVRIGNNAFENCSSLEELRLTRSVMYIDKTSFTGCDKLTIVTPAGYAAEKFAEENEIKYSHMEDDIEDYEFLIYSPKIENWDGTRTPDLSTQLSGPDLKLLGFKGSEDYDDFVLTGYRGGFTTLTIPDDDTCFSDSMYTGWSDRPLAGWRANIKADMESIKFGRIADIGAGAFSGAPKLKEIVLGKQTRVIGARAFMGCRLLKGDPEANPIAVVLPFTMESIGEAAFSGCVELENVDTDFTDESYISGKNVDNVSKDFKIDKFAFDGCTALKSFNSSFRKYEVKNANEGKNVTVDYFLKEMGESSFRNCKSLESVYFNGNLEKIGPKAFENCTSLETVTLDNSVLVQTNAFIGCTDLSSAIIVGEANVAVSNDPFCSSTNVVIATTEASKAQEYVDFKNRTAGNNYTVDLREFDYVNGKAYLKTKVSAPDEVIVYKDGKEMDKAKDHVIFTNELTFGVKDADPAKIYKFYVNGELVDGSYIVPEYISEIVVTYEAKDPFQPGDVNADGDIKADDSAITLQYVLNHASVKLDAEAIERANVDGDNEVTANDSAMILQKALVSTYQFKKK